MTRGANALAFAIAAALTAAVLLFWHTPRAVRVIDGDTVEALG